MNKQELIAKVARDTGSSKAHAAAAVNPSPARASPGPSLAGDCSASVGV